MSTHPMQKPSFYEDGIWYHGLIEVSRKHVQREYHPIDGRPMFQVRYAGKNGVAIIIGKRLYTILEPGSFKVVEGWMFRLQP